MALNVVACIFTRGRGSFEADLQRRRQRGDGSRDWSDQPTSPGMDAVSPEDGDERDRFFSEASRGNAALLTCLFQTSCLQDRENVNFYGFRLPTCNGLL